VVETGEVFGLITGVTTGAVRGKWGYDQETKITFCQGRVIVGRQDKVEVRGKMGQYGKGGSTGRRNRRHKKDRKAGGEQDVLTSAQRLNNPRRVTKAESRSQRATEESTILEWGKRAGGDQRIDTRGERVLTEKRRTLSERGSRKKVKVNHKLQRCVDKKKTQERGVCETGPPDLTARQRGQM